MPQYVSVWFIVENQHGPVKVNGEDKVAKFSSAEEAMMAMMADGSFEESEFGFLRCWECHAGLGKVQIAWTLILGA